MELQLLILITCVIFIHGSPIKTQEKCAALNCPVSTDGKINIHLVPHSHDDVGWLQTLDGYYFGTEGPRTYEHAGVQYIISSTVEALKNNPERRFIQVETAFFWKWWTHQNDQVKQDFIDLVNNGQIEMINGAWSMNDEAAAHYHSIIDQFTWGFRVLNETVGECGQPKIGWQIDPFGHSREHASIMKQLGFDGLIIGRIDYRDKGNRKDNKALDFKWTTSANLENSEIFTSMFPDFYVSVGGFCFDITCQDAPINTDDDSPFNNLQQKVHQFADVMDDYSTYYQTKNILIPMGGDFHFQAAEINFLNIDRLIQGFKDHEKYNVFYSTPSCYIKAVDDEMKANSLTYPSKTDDFFPYGNDPHSFWTGYFTSRPTSKRFERVGNNILQAAKQLASISRLYNGKLEEESITALRQAMGVMQHHDAITGTEKQFVANDYSRLMHNGIKMAETFMSKALNQLLQNYKTDSVDLGLSLCLLSNVSICEPTNSDRFMAVVYNPLGRSVSHYVRLPVQDGEYQVTGPDGEEIFDLVDSLSTFDFLPETASPKELVFKARNIPALGIKTYFVQKKTVKLHQSLQEDPIWKFGTDTTGFIIDEATSLLKSVTINGKTLNVQQQFLYYTPAVGDNNEFKNRSSGAYVFRPTSDPAKPLTTDPIKISHFTGKLVDEFKQIINDEVTQIIRVYKEEGDDFIEFDWLVGDLKIDKNNKIGREIITRYQFADFDSNGVFYTDSNGREQIKREKNKRSDYDYDPIEEPVASNYYPITSKLVIKDEAKDLEAAVLIDRAEGGTSLEDGTIELMVHRRLLHDDAYGVNEALNEEQYGKGLYARGQHRLVFGRISNIDKDITTAAKERDLAHKLLIAPLVFVKSTNDNDEWKKISTSINKTVQGLKKDLPHNIHLLTFEPWKGDTYLIRLEHTLEKNEDATLSAVAEVNLQEILPFSIIDIRESLLGANQILDEEVDSAKIVLKPMQIRTFIVRGSPVEARDSGNMLLSSGLLYICLFFLFNFFH